MIQKYIFSFFLLAACINLLLAFDRQLCGWPNETGVCVKAKLCPKSEHISINFLPKDNPNLHKTPIRCEKIADVCCKNIHSSDVKKCKIDDKDGKCISADTCQNKLEPNYGAGKIEFRRFPNELCQDGLVCCAEEMIPCDVGGKSGYCKEKCDSNFALAFNYGGDLIEPRKLPRCKEPLVCCSVAAENRGKFNQTKLCYGVCAKTCKNLQGVETVVNFGQGLIEDRRRPSKVKTGVECANDEICCNDIEEVTSENRGEFNQTKLCYGVCAKMCKNLEGLETVVNFGQGIIEDRRRPSNVKTGIECANDEFCCNDVEEIIEDTTCGRFNPPLIDRIVGGIDTQIAEYPWLVQITRQTIIHNQRAIVYICAGALIHPKIVVTTAHCLHEQNINSLFVRAGVYNVHETDELLPHQNRKVVEVISHDQFIPQAHLNNIALLILEDEFKLDKHIGTICLARDEFEHDLTQKCILAGWGKLGLDITSNYSEIPKKVDLNIVPSNECQSKLRKTVLGQDFVLHHGFICAFGESGEDACKGDGGAPLVCPVPGNTMRYYQAGIVSWGIGCGENPGVYVNIAKYRDWIDEQLSKIGDIDTNTYIF